MKKHVKPPVSIPKILKLESGAVRYTVRKSVRARRVSIVVGRDGSVTVVVPRGIREGSAERFIAEKREWIRRHLKRFGREPSRDLPRGTGRGFNIHKEAARELILRRIAIQNTHYGFSWKRIFIKNHSAQWGSCSANKNLNFNYRIVHLPEELVDYIIVHELCHLREMNHSKRFWNLVGKAIPRYEDRERMLKRYFL
ncbi:M48 family metallopeptidase [bacterium]|nr:M48 family metallopeptidase [bacterium]MCI0565682.1 M48 family metallopeptidase [bacterium]MCI0680404.1 M48 family metallopeptidase [bacterium]